MVSLLIDMRRTIARRELERRGAGWLVGAGVLGAGAALGTLALGVVAGADPAAGADVLALLFALWVGGRLAQSAMSGGDGTLRPELFASLGLPRRRLARALLIAGLLDPGLALLAIALGAVIAFGARAGVAAALVGLAGALLTTLLAGIASTVLGALLAPGSRRGRDAGMVVTAAAISLVALAGTLAPALIGALRARSLPGLSDVVRALPSGWAPDAVAAAARAEWAGAVAPLAGLMALTALAVLAWPAVLARRMSAAHRPATAVRPPSARRRLLARTPTAAVAAKELRLWGRDPIRLTCLLLALLVGAGVGALPDVTADTGLLLPFVGVVTTVIAGACAGNLYGMDGTSLWLTVTTPDSAAADVRGRQAAWLVLVAPYALAATVALTVLGGQGWAWPWALAILPALLGGAAGLAALGSTISVQPLDESGGPTPAWSLKIHLALVAVALTALPPMLVLAAAAHWHLGGWAWAALPVGVASGATLAWALGRRATARLADRQVAMLETLADIGR